MNRAFKSKIRQIRDAHPEITIILCSKGACASTILSDLKDTLINMYDTFLESSISKIS